MRAMARVGAAGLVLAAGTTAIGGPGSASAQPPDVAARTPVAPPDAARAASDSFSLERLRGELGRAMRGAGSGSGAWVYDTRAKRTVFADRPGRRRVLASNTKLFTTSAAIDRFGPDGRLQTRVWATGLAADEADPPAPQQPPADAEPSVPGNGVVEGSLYLVGDGDPALGSRSFARRSNLPLTSLKKLAGEVRKAGIRRVKGKLRVDATIFDRRRGTGVGGWSRYIGPLSGLVYNAGAGGGDLALATGRAFRRALRKRGVRVRGVAHGRVPGGLREQPALATARSPKLARLIDETNETSNNFYAEMLLKRLAARDGRRGTTKAGARRVRTFARRLGSKVRPRDGSGLSRANRASPRDVGRLLAEMLDHDAGPAFERSLPVAGREGTVRYRMRGTAAEGRCRAKTGTLTGVSALSGYCDAGGRTLAFSILMNGVDVATARVTQDRMAAAIARG
jgi:D-alanyl-D-alanine carboxypeptidase/D-alanyl-D-alanine-endopeptidase (penicillin-binding protein 4)